MSEEEAINVLSNYLENGDRYCQHQNICGVNNIGGNNGSVGSTKGVICGIGEVKMVGGIGRHSGDGGGHISGKVRVRQEIKKPINS